ncbi:PASTA domain-containing protein, partial [Solirubrobacter phytolaccae]
HAVVALELRPTELRARRRAFAEVRVRNEGDAPADVELTATMGAPAAARRAASAPAHGDAAPSHADFVSGRVDSASARVEFEPEPEREPRPTHACSISPSRVQVAPGEEVVARLEVRGPRHWLRRGEPVPVTVAAPGAHAEGTFRPRAAVPVWAVLVPILAAAVGVWQATRPDGISVPRVTGLSVPEARERLREAGLKAKQAPLPVAEPSEAGGVVHQDPPAGTQVDDGGDVTLSYYRASGVGTVTPEVTTSQLAPSDQPPADQQAPIAYTRANRVFVQFPGESETAVGGTVGEMSADPAWDPRTGELAYVRRAAPSSSAEIVAVDPHAPGTPHALIQGDGSYISPTFSPDGTRLAVIAEDGTGYGGSLCVVVPPALAPRCHHDPDWRYGRPTYGADGVLYALRRSTATTREGGWDELVRVNTDLAAEGEPLLRGDLRAVATGGDGRFGVLARRTGEAGYHAEVLSPTGAPIAVQSGDTSGCDVAWSGVALIVSAGACGGGEQVLRLDPANLDLPGTKLLDGGEPALVG